MLFSVKSSLCNREISRSRATVAVEYLESRRLLSAYYLSKAGSDSAYGSVDAPWRTIQKINSVSFKGGDSILFHGGQTFGGRINFSTDDHGSGTAPIRLGSYSTKGRATIYGSTSGALYAHDVAGLWISNLNF